MLVHRLNLDAPGAGQAVGHEAHAAEEAGADVLDSVLAVTGGTGKFANAHGEMKLHARDAKGSEYDFAYNLSH
jgi:hypothetical protein